jgi:hypothetical protein
MSELFIKNDPEFNTTPGQIPGAPHKKCTGAKPSLIKRSLFLLGVMVALSVLVGCEARMTDEPPVCGDGVVTGSEECDGDDLTQCEDYQTCEDCQCVDRVRASSGRCGNGTVEWNEECDGDDLSGCQPGQICENCQCVTYADAPACGNWVLNRGEQCDPPLSLALALGTGWEGICYNQLDGDIPMICWEDCTCVPNPCYSQPESEWDDCIDASELPFCGDGIAESAGPWWYEECDGDDLGICRPGQTCEGCRCVWLPGWCGNGILDRGEQCDPPWSIAALPNSGFSVWDAYCYDLMVEPNADLMICSDDCTCVPDPGATFCGNGVVDVVEIWNWAEECDGDDLSGCQPGQICENCQCVYQERTIGVCGDGVVNVGEECDGDILSGCVVGQTCENCQCVTTMASAPACGNGILDRGEQCDPPLYGAAVFGTPWEGICYDHLDGDIPMICWNDCTCVPDPCYSQPESEWDVCIDASEMPFCGDGVAEAAGTWWVEECDGDDLGTCQPGQACQNCRCVQVSVCGNGIVEAGEDCDGTDMMYCLAGQVCENCQCATLMTVCGDGYCDTTLENTDLCPEDCPCLDNGVCEPGEGFACADCGEPRSTCGTPCESSDDCPDPLSCFNAVCWEACLCGGDCGGGGGGCANTCVGDRDCTCPRGTCVDGCCSCP